MNERLNNQEGISGDPNTKLGRFAVSVAEVFARSSRRSYRTILGRKRPPIMPDFDSIERVEVPRSAPLHPVKDEDMPFELRGGYDEFAPNGVVTPFAEVAGEAAVAETTEDPAPQA